MRVVETATDAGGTTDSPSAVTAVVVSGAAPQNSAPPTISGTPTEGQTLVGTDGTWAGAAPIAFTYAWSRCDATGGACVADHGRHEQDLRARRGRQRQDAAPLRDGQERARQRDRDLGADRRDRRRSRPPASSRCPRAASPSTRPTSSSPALLVIDKVAFSPNPLRSRAAFTAKIHVSDTRGFSVRNALVFVQGLPFGRSSTPAEVKTGSDGTATLTLIPTHKLPLQRGASLVMFVRARVAGDKLIAGVSARRLVNLRVVPS